MIRAWKWVVDSAPLDDLFAKRGPHFEKTTSCSAAQVDMWTPPTRWTVHFNGWVLAFLDCDSEPTPEEKRIACLLCACHYGLEVAA